MNKVVTIVSWIVLVVIVLVFISISISKAQNDRIDPPEPQPQIETKMIQPNPFDGFSEIEARKLVIGSIEIDLLTGKVTWKKDMTPEAASRRFWDAVVCAFPEVKKAIIKEYVEKEETKLKSKALTK